MRKGVFSQEMKRLHKGKGSLIKVPVTLPPLRDRLPMAPRWPRCLKGLKRGEPRRHLSLGEPRRERWRNRLASSGRKRLPKSAADRGRRIEAPAAAPSHNCDSRDAGSSLNLVSCRRVAMSHAGDFVVMAGVAGIRAEGTAGGKGIRAEAMVSDEGVRAEAMASDGSNRVVATANGEGSYGVEMASVESGHDAMALFDQVGLAGRRKRKVQRASPGVAQWWRRRRPGSRKRFRRQAWQP